MLDLILGVEYGLERLDAGKLEARRPEGWEAQKLGGFLNSEFGM